MIYMNRGSQLILRHRPWHKSFTFAVFCFRVSRLCKTSLLQTVNNTGVTHRGWADSKRRFCYCLIKPEWARLVAWLWTRRDRCRREECQSQRLQGQLASWECYTWHSGESAVNREWRLQCSRHIQSTEVLTGVTPQSERSGENRKADRKITCVQVAAQGIKRPPCPTESSVLLQHEHLRFLWSAPGEMEELFDQSDGQSNITNLSRERKKEFTLKRIVSFGSFNLPP